MSTITNIIGISLMFSLVSCVTVTPIEQSRVFKKPLYTTISKNLRAVDKTRTKLLDRIYDTRKRMVPADLKVIVVLRDTEYSLYIAYQLSIATGDAEGASYYEKELINIYVAQGMILNKYAKVSKGGFKSEYIY